MSVSDEDELRQELMETQLFVITVKTRFYLAMCGWALTGTYLFLHWYFDH